MPKKRSPGDGGLWYNESKGLWIGAMDIGFTPEGKRKQKYVSAKKQSDARAKLQKLKKEIAQYGAPLEAKQARTNVKDWAQEWLTIQESKLRPSSYNATRSAITKWVIPTIGQVKLVSLRPPHIRSVHDAMFNAGLATSSVSRAHAVMNSLLSDAITEGGYEVPESVFKVAAPTGTKATRAAMPLDDALAVLQAAHSDPQASRWVAALLQALRPAEARGLIWEHIDFQNDLIDISWQLKPLPYRIPRDTTSGFRVPRDYETKHLVDSYHLVRPKTDAGHRKSPLVPWMKAALLEWHNNQGPTPYGLVWTRHDGRPLSDKEDVKAWKALCVRAKVPEYDLYEARHTAATLLRVAGVDDETIIAIMGHASILSSKQYLHTDQERTRAALLKVAQMLQLEA